MTVIEQSLIEQARDPRLKSLLTYLAADPENANLKADAADQALNAKEPGIATAILGGDLDSLDERELNVAGLAHLQIGAFDAAAEAFERLLSGGIEDAAVRFNLAWCLAMLKQFDRALELLTDDVTTSIPQAAMLRLQLLHDRGEFEGAAEFARHIIELHPDHPGLNAAASVLALDIDDADLARACALKAGSHPDALTTLGTLALADQQLDAAREHFDQALETNQTVPRAWIGRGLTKLLAKDAAGATIDLDRGAELFDDHEGSWTAAGWAHLIAGDRSQARIRFERALAIEEDAEAQGSLAVVEALDGRRDEANRRIEAALRLDPECVSVRLAQALLSAEEGDQESAKALFESVLQMPINEQGQTAIDMLAKLGLK